MDINFSFMIFILISGCRVETLYFPLHKMHFQYRVGEVPKVVSNLTALLYSGRPAPAFFTMSMETTTDVTKYLKVEENGVLSWERRVTVPLNLTAKVDATYKGQKAETEIQISVLPALPDPCKLPLEEVCFPSGETDEFLVYEDTQIPIKLLDFKTIRLPCKLERPQYSLKAIKRGESAAGRLEDGVLEVTPALARGDFQLTIICSKDKESVSRSVRVQLMPSRVRLPFKPPSVCRRLVSGVTQGANLLLTWAVVKSDTPIVLEGLSKSLPYNLRLVKHNFTSDVVNATLVLVNLTWTRTDRNLTDIKVPVILNCSSNKKQCGKNEKNCIEKSKDCLLEISCEVVVVANRYEVQYPKRRLKVIASPFARISQPAVNGNSSSVTLPYVFQSALPEILESPFDVTREGGIVYLTDWSVGAKEHTASSPGILVEWVEPEIETGSGVGLAWLEVSVAVTDCTSWVGCAKARNAKACVRSCRIAAASLGNGRCEWRENNFGDRGMVRGYATCSPDLTYCPDKVCDPLEQLHFEICSQDCTTLHVLLGTLGTPSGIATGKGTCSCDETSSCHCGVEVNETKTGEGRGLKKQPKQDQKQNKPEDQEQEQPLEPPKLTAIEDVSHEEGKCDIQCISIIVSLSAVFSIILAALIFLTTSRTCTLRKKDNEGMEYSAHALLPMSNTENRTTPAAETLVHHHEIDPKWEVPRSKLIVEECLGEGEFGRVLKATARDLPNNPGFMTVAVKTLKENAGSSELEDLMSEYQLLKEVSHPNVIKLLGACTTPGAPVYIIIEFCALGSLRAYLRRHRNIRTATDILSFQNCSSEITPHDILSCAWQISKGMSYLAEIKLVHRDLAARNILLATGKVCKISDFGLTRDVYEDDTYLKKSRGRVPVKWMALESLSDHVYTSKSDVWSFGIVLWELVTLGSSPYPGVAIQNLYHLLKNGYRMQKPNNCSDQLYEIMKDCWAASPSDRPSFSHLMNKFERMLEDGADYLDCNVNMVSNPSYFAPVNERGPPGDHEMDITFKMDFDDDEDTQETDLNRYENDSVNKNTSYDTPKPISSILMSDLILKDEER